MKVYKMKKILILILCAICAPTYAATSEFFENTDVNAMKAGISKYLLTRGANIFHNNSYEANDFQAAEIVRTGTYSQSSYNYAFNLTPNGKGVILTVAAIKDGGSEDNIMETKLIQNIRQSMTGRFLYGLGFEFDYYDTVNGKIKAPKGKETGIVITGVKYDALNKGLMAGDIITEINNVPLSKIPMEEFSTILFAKSINDTIKLTYKRGNTTNKVNLTPRASNRKVF